ncbi:MAG: hypothetical protein L6277_10440 [Desulfobacterales bacterium]|nr:hypothetical protein [Pseudomonadota bacterium]MCG2772491.1 hypothetical protein [Desulfobacterales bacterium]
MESWITTDHLQREIKKWGKKWEILYKERASSLNRRFFIVSIMIEKPLSTLSKLHTIHQNYFELEYQHNETWKNHVSAFNILEPKLEDILNLKTKSDGELFLKLSWYTFVVGWMNFAINNSDLVEGERKFSDLYSEVLKKINTITFHGDLLKTFPNFPQGIRLSAAQRLYKKPFSDPIHSRKKNALNCDIYRELSFRAGKKNLSKEEKKKLKKVSILGSILQLPLYPVPEYDERPLWDLSVIELSKKPEILKRAMGKLHLNDLVPKGYHTYLGHTIKEYPYEEVKKRSNPEGISGELELVATPAGKKLVDEWVQKEMIEFYLGDKLKSLNLTPRERDIIDVQLSGKKPTGTSGSVKVALSKLKDKIQKK